MHLLVSSVELYLNVEADARLEVNLQMLGPARRSYIRLHYIYRLGMRDD